MQLLASHVFLHSSLSTWGTRYGNPVFLCFICNWSFARRWPLTRSTLLSYSFKGCTLPCKEWWDYQIKSGTLKGNTCLCVCVFSYSCNPGINNNHSAPPRLLQIDYNYRPSVPLSASQKQSWCNRCCSLIRRLEHPSKMSFPTLAIHWWLWWWWWQQCGVV